MNRRPEIVSGDPPMTVPACRRHPVATSIAVADDLERSGWRIDRQRHPDCLHLIVNPVHAQVAARFLADLEAAYETAPAMSGPRSSAVVYGVSAIPVAGDLEETMLRHLEMRYDEG